MRCTDLHRPRSGDDARQETTRLSSRLSARGGESRDLLGRKVFILPGDRGSHLLRSLPAMTIKQ